MSRDTRSTPISPFEPRRQDPALGPLLVQQGVISDEEYASALSRSEQSGHSIWTALRGASVILPRRTRRPDHDHAADDDPARSRSESVGDPSPGPIGSFAALEDFTSIPALVSDLFEGTVRLGATDIHLDPTPAGVRIRIRVDGLLHDVGMLPEEVGRHVRSRIKVLAGMDVLEKREPQDGHISLPAGSGHRDYRIGTLLTGLGERMVVRFHQVAERGLSLDDLGLEHEQATVVRRLLTRPRGLILVAGPIGSGKTTTLYSCLQALAGPTRSLITIEDPIEYHLAGVNQVEVRPKLGLSFARGLRAVLRQDPDIIMVGEIRDRDTARIAGRASATGAVVLSSVHAVDGAGVLRSLANYGVTPQRIGDGLAGIIVQRLVRSLCDSCKRPVGPDVDPSSTLVEWGMSEGEAQGATCFTPGGCPQCLGTGYRGRTGVFEVIEPGADAEGRRFDLPHAAARKVGRGLTTIEEVRRILPTRGHSPGGPPPSSSLARSSNP